MNKKITIVLIFLSLFLFACKGFSDTAQVKEEIIKSIEYNNYPSHTVFVNAVEGTGSFIQGGGTVSIKKTDSFDIEFSASQDYKFIRWIVVDRTNTSVSKSNYIKFSDEYSPKTRATLLDDQDEILIRPYCLPYLTVTDFTPEYRENGVGYNSDIKITFSEYIKEEAFSFTNKEINELELKYSDLLKTKSFDDTEYVYGYVKNQRTVYKNIDINHMGSSIVGYFEPPVIINGKTLLLKLKKQYYDVLLNERSSEVTEVSVTLGKDIFDVHNISFADNYSKLSFTYAINSNIIADTPSATVTFSTPEGTGTINPAGQNTIYTELSYPISFEPTSSYFFKNWGVFYASNGEPLPNSEQIIQIEDKTQKNTKFVLTTALSGILVQPVCALRPYVLLTSPSSDNGRADSIITITFSESMKKSDLRWSYSDIQENSIQTILRDSEQQIYGYVTNGGEHFWHNIQIFSTDGINLLSYFKGPEYNQDTTKLTIEPNPQKIIPSGTIVVVKINKSIRDINDIPCGNDDEYIEFRYLVN